MSKKTFIIAILISLIVLTIGIILICLNLGPYNFYSDLANDPSSRLYLIGISEVGKYAFRYFSGIAMTIVGCISIVLAFLGNLFAKKNKPILEDTKNILD